MADYRQAFVMRSCPDCGANVLLRWSPVLNGGKGFVNARCLGDGCGSSWYAGSYAECPVEEMGKPRKALDALVRLRSGRGADGL